MQTDLNSRPSFGMALKITNDAKALITRRIRTEKDIDKLAKLIDSQKNNPYQLEIRTQGTKGDSFEAFIRDISDNNDATLINTSEGWIQKTFRSPIAFIEDMCKVVDKLNDKKYNPKMRDKINNVLNTVD